MIAVDANILVYAHREDSPGHEKALARVPRHPIRHRPLAMTLLQTGGYQTWPNFLAVLGCKPGHVVYFTSADPDGRFSAAIRSLMDAAGLAGHRGSWEMVSTNSPEPTLEDCLSVLTRLAPESIHLVNLTGGTKMMSLAAFEFARANRIPAFYLDTRRAAQAFEDLKTGPLPCPFPELSALSRQITVRTALAAQGFHVPTSFKSPPDSHRAFSAAAVAIRRDEAADLEISHFLAGLRGHLMGPNDCLLKKGKLRAALQRPVEAPPGSHWQRYLQTAADLGIIRQLDPGQFRLVTLDPKSTDAGSLHSEANTNFKLLDGIWFELAVLERLRANPSFSDICWSVESDKATDPTASSKGETDLVAFNHETFNLHFISCKTTGPHTGALDHIQGLRRRASKEGGNYSEAELWIFRPKSSDHRRELENHCKEQNVRLRVFTDCPAFAQSPGAAP